MKKEKRTCHQQIWHVQWNNTTFTLNHYTSQGCIQRMHLRSVEQLSSSTTRKSRHSQPNEPSHTLEMSISMAPSSVYEAKLQEGHIHIAQRPPDVNRDLRFKVGILIFGSGIKVIIFYIHFSLSDTLNRII
ncbi:glycoside hydrolase family 1 protein [Medicago truncatula]|uniref:Glycoside hydrolase family 1 protein n=1 Tax=Medicago truncatula TaxID=3880 RepID=A0A072UPM4_MEDTR|nr:glycoside hydrolase family 1 protein [Medicago truncatula]